MLGYIPELWISWACFEGCIEAWRVGGLLESLSLECARSVVQGPTDTHLVRAAVTQKSASHDLD